MRQHVWFEFTLFTIDPAAILSEDDVDDNESIHVHTTHKNTLTFTDTRVLREYTRPADGYAHTILFFVLQNDQVIYFRFSRFYHKYATNLCYSITCTISTIVGNLIDVVSINIVGRLLGDGLSKFSFTRYDTRVAGCRSLLFDGPKRH